jgi:alpha-beta hydrolase superfamily lysophospholipase
VKYVEEMIGGADEARLYLRRSETERPRGEVVIVHGFAEHSGRYAPLVDHLVSRSYCATAYDQRGHGQSEGLAGHVDRFSDYEHDLDRVVSYVHSRGCSRTIFIIGHSMGGLVTLRYVSKNRGDLAGAVISAPLVAIAGRVPAHKLLIARVGARVAPRLRLDNEINPGALSRDPEVGRAYADDPLVHHLVSTRWFAETVQAMEEVKRWADQIRLPLLIMHGTEDRLADPAATRSLFEQIASVDKELVIYEGYYHELFNEPEKADIFERVTDWLTARAS